MLVDHPMIKVKNGQLSKMLSLTIEKINQWVQEALPKTHNGERVIERTRTVTHSRVIREKLDSLLVIDHQMISLDHPLTPNLEIQRRVLLLIKAELAVTIWDIVTKKRLTHSHKSHQETN